MHKPPSSLPLIHIHEQVKKNMGVLTRKKKQEKQDSRVKGLFLKIVRPGGQVELYRDPIPARGIMERYPRHCITRPDFFDYPWVVVRPDSVLEPGNVFFLVPYHTVDKVTKDKMQQFQQTLLDRPLHPPAEPAPRFRGVAHDHKRSIVDRHNRRDHHRSNLHEERCHRRQRGNDQSHDKSITSDPESDNGSLLYKEIFYESWEEMRRRLEQVQEEREDSPSESRRLSQELEAKPCLKKAENGRKRVDLKVRFSTPIVIPGSQRATPAYEGEDLH